MAKSVHVPVSEKAFLTITEAAAYFNIGENKLREITDDESLDLVLWCGNKRLIKRAKTEKFLNEQYSV